MTDGSKTVKEFLPQIAWCWHLVHQRFAAVARVVSGLRPQEEKGEPDNC